MLELRFADRRPVRPTLRTTTMVLLMVVAITARRYSRRQQND